MALALAASQPLAFAGQPHLEGQWQRLLMSGLGADALLRTDTRQMLAAAPDEKDAAGKTPEPTKLDVPLGAGITLQMAVEEFALGEPAWESVEIPDDYRILS